MFPNFTGDAEKVFYKSERDGVGGVRSSLGQCAEMFFAARVDGDARMLANIRSGEVRRSRPDKLKSLEASKEFSAGNKRQIAQRQNDDKALSS